MQIDRSNVLQVLGQVGWLSEQPVAFQVLIAAAGRWQRFARGQRLYDEGDRSDALFGLAAGQLDVAVAITGDEAVVIHRAPPGFWIGDSGLLAEAPRSICVTAASDCLVFRVPAAAVRRLLAEHPEYWVCFAKLAHRNGTLALNVLAEVLSLPPRARFARMLLRMAAPDGSLHVTQAELCRMAGMSRAAFRRAFREVIASGVVATGYGGLRIIDRVALDAIANDP